MRVTEESAAHTLQVFMCRRSRDHEEETPRKCKCQRERRCVCVCERLYRFEHV